MSCQPIILVGESKIRFSYSQIIVFDDGERAPGSMWTEAHWRQGFARRSNTVSFLVLVQAGIGSVCVLSGRARELEEYIRVVAVPLSVPSGKVRIEGPEEYPIDRYVIVDAGNYCVTLAQRIDESGEIRFDLFFDGNDVREKSQVIVADAGIIPGLELVETADPA